MFSTKVFVLGLLPFALVACMSRAPTISEEFGAAVRHNMALQTVNPDAAGPDESASLDGQKAEQALQDYREGPTDAPPERLIINLGGGN